METPRISVYNKEEYYDPALNFDEELFIPNNHKQCEQDSVCSKDELDSEEDCQRIHNNLSSSIDSHSGCGPQNCCELGYCTGGKLSPKYAQKRPHITEETELFVADENRWACRKPHDKLCKSCYHSKTCPVHGLDFGRL